MSDAASLNRADSDAPSPRGEPGPELGKRLPFSDAPSAPRFVVGVGASAGGLEALEAFFDKAPTDCDGAFVVVMHLAPDFRSVLDELIARRTRMPVKLAADGGELQPNHVYVIQPRTEIEVAGPRLRVTMRPEVHSGKRLSTIDALFESIAATWGERGAGVVLSGSGSDGSKGVVALHAAGGVAFAQSPETAKFDAMPAAAISTHCVSAVDTPEALAQIVVESVFLPRAPVGARRSAAETQAMQGILAAVVGSSHLDASQYAHSAFERRVQRRMNELQIKSLAAYSELVGADRAEARALCRALLIGVSDFFRDDTVFQALAQLAIPDVIRRAAEEKRPARVWAPGCASGEEAYSLAMLLAEAALEMSTPVEFQIFATDVHSGLLTEAARGEYSDERMTNVSPERRRDFFTRASSGVWRVAPSLRKNVVFAPHDVLADPPFTRLDMVSCRNLLIYFSTEAQQRVLGSFAFGLIENGFLLLGASETVGAQRESFEFVDVRRRIFRRNRAPVRSLGAPRPMEPIERYRALATITPVTHPRRSSRLREAHLQPIYAAMLKEFAPASLLVSPERELMHTFGDMRRFLRAPEGVVRFDVTDMCDPALKTPIAAGVDRVLRDKKELKFSHILLQEFPKPGALVDLTVRPVFVEGDSIFILLMISEIANPPASAPPPTIAEMTVDARAAELEAEVLRTREALQATIEEIETTNEELKAANEELMSSNEELQSTNEELSSLNEELHSVNAEHARQNNELMRLTRDFDALLHATEIGVLFLDEGFKIRRFTKLIGELFQFAESDVGRSLTTFRSPFGDFALEDFLLRAMRKTSPQEMEAKDHSLRAWLLRAVSYPDQKGVVLSVISFSHLREATHATIDARARLFSSAAPFGGDPLIIVEPESCRVVNANRRAYLEFGAPEFPTEAFEISRLTPEWGSGAWSNWLSTIHIGETTHRLDVQLLDHKGAIVAVDLQATLFRDEGRPRALIRIIENHGRAEAVRELQERARSFAVSNRELEQFASVVAHDLRAPLRHMSQFAEFLAAELGQSASADAREYLQIIRSSAGSMSNMIERLLDYARIGVGPPKLTTMRLGECLDEATELLTQDLSAAKLDIDIVSAGMVRGDAVLATRLFQNLLQNALKFTRPGVTPEIAIRAENDGDSVVVSVSDNGIGIPPDKAHDIFKMFTRLHSEREYSGNGMGLAICRRICEVLGGSIQLDPAHTPGARFLITLPRAWTKTQRTGA